MGRRLAADAGALSRRRTAGTETNVNGEILHWTETVGTCPVGRHRFHRIESAATITRSPVQLGNPGERGPATAWLAGVTPGVI